MKARLEFSKRASVLGGLLVGTAGYYIYYYGRTDFGYQDTK